MSAVSPNGVHDHALQRTGSSLCLTTLGRYVFDRASYMNVLSSETFNDSEREDLL